MRKLVHILLPAIIACPAASAEIYKCVGNGGLDLYQNFPCPIASPGWMPKDVPSDSAPPAVSNIDRDRTKPATLENVDGRAASSRGDVPVVGMVADEVRAIWGQPTGDAIHGLVPIWRTAIDDSPIEIWTYGATRSVQFDQTGHVSVLRR